MNSPAKAHEPTMEEILASIRRIISDDDKAPASAAPPKAEAVRPEAAPPAKPAAATVDQDDIDALFAAADKEAAVGQDDIDALFAEAVEPLKASEPVKAPPPPPAPPTAVQPEALENDLDILDLTDEMREPEPEPVRPAPAAPPPAPEPAPAPKLSTRIDDGLVSAAVSDQVSSAFGSLAHTVLAGNAKTLEDIVREMLRPMLKTWLDDNLPPMVERLVRHEIERVARGGR